MAMGNEAIIFLGLYIVYDYPAMTLKVLFPIGVRSTEFVDGRPGRTVLPTAGYGQRDPGKAHQGTLPVQGGRPLYGGCRFYPRLARGSWNLLQQ